MSFSYSENDKRLIWHAEEFMHQTIEAAGGRETWVEHDTAHLMGGCRMGNDPRESVTDADGRTWEIPNLWTCDGSLHVGMKCPTFIGDDLPPGWGRAGYV